MILTHGANSLSLGGGGDFVEIGGRMYPVVKIGNQFWLAQNLDLLAAGIALKTDSNRLTTTDTDPQAAYLNYDEATYGWNGKKCGLIYNAGAIGLLKSNTSTLFPGWHIPTIGEWQALVAEVGSNSRVKLSSTYDWDWNKNGTDDYGFCALPANSWNGNMTLMYGLEAWFYTSTIYSSSKYAKVFFRTSNSEVSYDTGLYDNAYLTMAIRLVKDAT